MAADEGGAHIDGAGVDSTGGGRGSMCTTVTLNTRRLTTQRLRQLAGGLGVPSSVSPEDLRALIEGKLTEDGRDPLRMQVVLSMEERCVYMPLQDETGVFLEIKPLATEDPHRERRRRGRGGP